MHTEGATGTKKRLSSLDALRSASCDEAAAMEYWKLIPASLIWQHCPRFRLCLLYTIFAGDASSFTHILKIGSAHCGTIHTLLSSALFGHGVVDGKTRRYRGNEGLAFCAAFEQGALDRLFYLIDERLVLCNARD